MSDLMIQALSSPTRARAIWLEYRSGNTQGLTEYDINQIETRWAMFVPSWEDDSSIDYNAYVIGDDNYDALVEESSNDSGEQTGLDNVKANKTGRWVNTGATAGLSVGSGVCALAAKDGTMGMFEMAESQSGLGECASQNTMAYVAIGLAVANVAKYYLTKPNEQAHDACVEMQEHIATGQEATNTAADTMLKNEQSAIALSDEATYLNESTNSVFVVEKTEFDFFASSLDNLQKKAETDGGLDSDEMTLYNTLAVDADATYEVVNTMAEDTQASVEELYTQMEGYQQEFDDAAGTIADLQGMTEYVASFDESTVKTCKWETIGQYTNAGSATIAAGKLMATGMWWNYAVAAVGFGAAVGSMFAANEQSNMKLDVERSVNMRKAAEQTGTSALATYDSTITGYGSALNNVENLEMLIPEDTQSNYVAEAPEKADREENEEAED